jgi:hypothetical protein
VRLNDLEGGHIETDILSISELRDLRARYYQYLSETPTSDPRRGFVVDWIEDLDAVIEHRHDNQEGQ